MSALVSDTVQQLHELPDLAAECFATWGHPNPSERPVVAVKRIYPKAPADLDTLVPVKPQPAHDVDQEVVRLLVVAAGVGVLDAEDERAAVVAREGPAEQSRAGHADVRVAGRRRAEPGDDGLARAGSGDSVSHARPPG